LLENLDLFAVPPEVESGKQTIEPERESASLENPPGSIGWYAEKQREYWNRAFPWAKK